MSKVRVKFFAIFRETTGLREDRAEISAGTTVEQLWQQYAARFPRLPRLRAAYAVNQRLVKADQVLNDGDEVAFLPPVSGGAPKDKSVKRKAKSSGRASLRKKNIRADSRTKTERPLGNAFITRKPIDLNALYRAVAFPGAGAIITFSGVVRDNAQGKSVDHLEYEAYPEMAEQSMREIIAEIKTRWADTRVAMAHRIGRLKTGNRSRSGAEGVGDASLVIAVASPHRPEAYAASRYAIERVKAILPVWKKEFWTDGEHWVEGPVAGEVSAEKADEIVRKAETDAR